MAYDMYESKFRRLLGQLPEFTMPAEHNQKVWDMDFPAWRSLFTSLLLYGHGTGYRVFSFDDFYKYVERAWTVVHPDAQRYQPYFSGDLREPMRRRIAIWYSSGMVEHQVYLALVEGIEDSNQRCGVVFYDPRVDWKMKCDALVICNNHLFRINVQWNEEKIRHLIEARRDKTELVRKKNTDTSSHWGNSQLKNIVEIPVSPRSAADISDVKGLKLLSYNALNRALNDIYDRANIYNGRTLGPKTAEASAAHPH